MFVHWMQYHLMEVVQGQPSSELAEGAALPYSFFLFPFFLFLLFINDHFGYHE